MSKLTALVNIVIVAGCFALPSLIARLIDRYKQRPKRLKVLEPDDEADLLPFGPPSQPSQE